MLELATVGFVSGAAGGLLVLAVRWVVEALRRKPVSVRVGDDSTDSIQFSSSPSSSAGGDD